MSFDFSKCAISSKDGNRRVDAYRFRGTKLGPNAFDIGLKLNDFRDDCVRLCESLHPRPFQST